MSKCSVEGCNTKSRANGLCNKHLMRMRLTGTTDPGVKARAPIGERLGRHFEKRSPHECWLWTGDRNKQGYGRIAIGPKGETSELAHRVAWEVATGRDIPSGMVILHTCDTPACVNPAHLQLGTQSENLLDMWAKRRGKPANQPQGAAHYCARFTDDQIREIRKSKETSAELAKRFCVHKATIAKIRARKTWKHLE